MDFFERIFHVAPDGGNGFLEFILLLGVIALCSSTLWRTFAQGNGKGV